MTIAMTPRRRRRRGTAPGSAAAGVAVAPPAAPLPAPPRRASASLVAGARRRRRAGGGQRPDRSRRRPCLRRRGRDGTARPRTVVRAAAGDSLWSIAERHHGDVSLTRYVDALIDLNGGTRHRRRPARPPAVTRRLGSRWRQYPRPVHCPVCHADDTKVVDSRLAEEGAAVRRRRHCLVVRPPLHHVRAGRRGAARRRQVRRPAASRSTGPRSSPASSPRRRAATSTPAVVEQIAEADRGRRAPAGLGGHQRPDRPRRARPPAHARRGRLPALRQRLQELRRRRRLPPRDRAAHQGAPRR